MRTSQYPLSTLKETPTNTEVISHQLMLRAGMIRKLASGLYTWLPTGLRVLRKIENIIRKEMSDAGAIEILMPMIQPANLWQESGRWEYYGSELLHFIDRSGRQFVLSPTHEEMITFLIRNELKSYKQLPLNFFQIQTKFRDELRPRFGVIRSREFLMKDAYSFHISQESLQETYNKMYNVYNRIFTRIGLNFRVVRADTGHIGGNISHEFQVLMQNKKNNTIFHSNFNCVNKNIELIKSLVSLQIKNNLNLADNIIDIQIITELMMKQLKLLSIDDYIVVILNNLSTIIDSNKKYYFDTKNNNTKMVNIKNIYNMINNNSCSDNKNILVTKQSIEVGHIFQLGTEYSRKIKAVIQDENGHNKDIIMGCYGIGLTRVVAAAIEQSHDDHGVVWLNNNIAPFQVAIIPINMYKSFCVQKLTEKIYTELCIHDIEVLIDDRKECLGVMLNDMELIGIPHIVIVSDRNLSNNNIEYKCRYSGMKQLIKTSEILNFLINIIKDQ